MGNRGTHKAIVDLYSLLCNPLWLRVAHQKVNANQGRETAGIDGQSMRDFNADLEGNLERLRQLLRAKTFEPLPVRRVYIPKSHGKKRPLVERFVNSYEVMVAYVGIAF